MVLPLGNSQTNIPPTGLNTNNFSGATSLGSQVGQQDNTNVIGQLQQFGWQVGSGPMLYFPITNIQDSITQELVQHKFPDLDGAIIENTGRNPTITKAHAIFVNTISPGPGENWKQGTLYPAVYTQVMQSALQRQTGVLQHPVLGSFTAKLQSAETVLEADFRGGQVIELTFIETNNNNIFQNLQNFTNNITTTASNLDTLMGTLSPNQQVQLQQYYNPATLNSIMFGLGVIATASGAIQGTTTIATNIISSIAIGNFSTTTNAMLSGSFSLPTQLAILGLNIYNTVQLIGAFNSLNDQSYAAMNNQAWLFYNNLLQYEKQLNTQQQQVLTYIPPMPTTLSAIALLLDVDLQGLIQLNPNLMSLPTVPAHSIVQYWNS